ncbi:MAG: 50S ribosomal protein L22 [Alphaproteobacteria bacterium]|nr:MAG: 50S ribosomal protein L22 [Alphaproteobacteria bacterium]
MSKKAKARALAPTESKAISKNLRVSPRKLNLVAQTIRGKKVGAALQQLNFSPKRIAVDVKKCLQSAVANAENNQQLDIDRLVVKEAYVGVSFAMRRFHARGRGRASPVIKPFAHLTVVVAEQEKQAKASKTQTNKESA